VFEAESQALLLNTTSRMHFKNGTSAGNGAYARNGATLRVLVASKPKVSFWPESSTSPGNYEYKKTNSWWVGGDSIPNDDIGFDLSNRTTALGSTEPPTEMSTLNLPEDKGKPERKAGNLTAICEPSDIVGASTSHNPTGLQG
jgi:hypothetical protein